MNKMVTRTEPQTIAWGKNVRVVTDEAATFFYNAPGWNALGDAQRWAAENNGRVESAHGILKRRSQEDLKGPSWNWLTPNYEEDVGLDLEGRFGNKGEAVMLAIQGGGIMLSSPQRLQEAYTNRTPKGEPSLTQEEISQVLAGVLPNGQQIMLYTPEQLSKESVKKLPETYAIVSPLKVLEGIKSGEVNVGRLPKNGLFIDRAGHPEIAEDYARTLKNAGVREYGNWHTLASVDPKNPSGRALHTRDSHYNGLSSNYYLGNDARFVGVRASGAEGAAPQKQASPLEEVLGKARDAGNGVLVINAKDISPAAYNALTSTK